MAETSRQKAIDQINELIIADLVAAKLEGEQLMWHKPYLVYPKKNFISKTEYSSSVNRLLLAMDDDEYYLTPKQLETKKGKDIGSPKEHRIISTFFPFKRKVADESQLRPWETKIVKDGVMYGLSFSYKAIELIKLSKTNLKAPERKAAFEPRKDIEKFIQKQKIKVIESNNWDKYDMDSDTVYIPSKAQFENATSYYNHLFRSMARATAHKSRLDRFKGKDFEDFKTKQINREELTCTIAAATMCSVFGFTDFMKPTVEYIDGLISSLAEDDQLFVMAARSAEKILDFFKVFPKA